MDLELLKSTIQQHESASLGNITGDLAIARANSLSAYLSEPYGNEQDGRSQVVTSDVADVIESIMPGLVRVFTSGDEICELEPFGSEDEEAAKQETDVINYYVTQANNYAPFIMTWLRDGLMQKVGYAKALWEDDEFLEQESYENLSDDELSFLLQDDDREIVSYDMTEEGWSIKLKKTVRRGRPKLFNCSPETILVNNDHTEVSLRNAKFVQHRTRMTISEVRELGYKVSDDIGDMHERYSFEEVNRDRFGDELLLENTNDPASRVVMFKENWIRYDGDGDGYTELRKVVMVGSEILLNEETDSIPICAWTPVIMPHKHIGRSLSEQVEDIQLTKTTILRQALDNLYLSNNGRWAISDQVNVDDMLVSRPGGIVRLNDGAIPGAGHIVPMVPPALAGQAFPALEYMDNIRESRTGITRYTQGLDANSLNKTATGIQAIMSAGQGRIELVAKSFAETGLRDMMLLVHELIRKHSDKETVIKLRGEWITVDPRIWKTRYDMRVSVGLGTGNREQQMANMMQIMNAQREAFQIGVATPENIYNSLSRFAEIAGFKSPEMFFTKADPKPAGIPPELQKQAQQMQEQLKKLAEENQKLQAELIKKDLDKSVEMHKIDTVAQSDIMKTQMQNESKEQIAQMQYITKTLLEAQQEMTAKMNEINERDDNMAPILQQMQEEVANIMRTIEGLQPVGIKQIRDESGRLIGGVRILADGTEQEISIQ